MKLHTIPKTNLKPLITEKMFFHSIVYDIIFGQGEFINITISCPISVIVSKTANESTRGKTFYD